MKINWVIEYLKDLFTKKECSGCHKRFNPRVIIPFHGKMWCPECWRKISIKREKIMERATKGKRGKYVNL
jgi:recombinational DNA repair protein (RecF pathway)